MIFSNTPNPESIKSLRDVAYTPYWLDDPARPAAHPALVQPTTADLVVIGAGFTGLWTALLEKQAHPEADIVLLEAGQVGCGASGRNGGFVAACLTHSFENGLSRWRAELPQLLALGHENLTAIEDTIAQYQIDCDYIRSGEIHLALEGEQMEEFLALSQLAASYGEKYTVYDASQVHAMVDIPLACGGIYYPANGIVNPARLAWGLRRACLALGVRLFEHTCVRDIRQQGSRLVIKTDYGEVTAQKAALATNAFPPVIKHISRRVVPVYDYVLMTEPLTPAQRELIGWQGRQGLSDAANQFHYYQITKEGRILWGGYDAIYHAHNAVAPELEYRPASFARLATHFFQNFPQLEGLRFTHAWGGAIDTCSRYTVFWGSEFGGRLVYALGYTGLGVGASRFGAQVMLDLLHGAQSARTALQMTRSKPFPFPPEPFRTPVINFTRWSLSQADANHGARNLWLRTLDALGLGFDS